MNGQYLNTVTETLFIDINTPIFKKKIILTLSLSHQ